MTAEIKTFELLECPGASSLCPEECPEKCQWRWQNNDDSRQMSLRMCRNDPYKYTDTVIVKYGDIIRAVDQRHIPDEMRERASQLCRELARTVKHWNNNEAEGFRIKALPIVNLHARLEKLLNGQDADISAAEAPETLIMSLLAKYGDLSGSLESAIEKLSCARSEVFGFCTDLASLLEAIRNSKPIVMGSTIEQKQDCPRCGCSYDPSCFGNNTYGLCHACSDELLAKCNECGRLKFKYSIKCDICEECLSECTAGE